MYFTYNLHWHGHVVYPLRVRGPKTLGVLAQQWDRSKLLVKSTVTLDSIYSKNPAKLIFRYWCQADLDLVFKSLANDTELPSRYS